MIYAPRVGDEVDKLRADGTPSSNCRRYGGTITEVWDDGRVAAAPRRVVGAHHPRKVGLPETSVAPGQAGPAWIGSSTSLRYCRYRGPPRTEVYAHPLAKLESVCSLASHCRGAMTVAGG